MSGRRRLFLAALLCLGLGGGTAAAHDPQALRKAYAGPVETWPAPWVPDGIAVKEMGPVPPPRHPHDNPGTPEKIELGRKLFEDPTLSLSGQFACADCHFREIGFTDRLRRSFGHDRQIGRRNAISILNAGFYDLHFWDGGAETLERQALMAMTNPVEMAADAAEIDARLKAGPYRDALRAVFGTPEGGGLEDALKALAAFVRAQTTRSRFDTFLNGRREVLTDQQLHGLHLFRTKGRCMTCHHGPLLTDGGFHNLGLHRFGEEDEDLGRYEVTGDPADRGAFRTPTLRGVAATGPWMHTGRFRDLRVVVAFYNAGGLKSSRPGAPPLSPLLQPLNLTPEEMDALRAFLEVL
ncbi:cytochrome-c peroxidase [Telmatospirillum sp. J64-1]|uniref:cytochrome-c peroxidase n=1 Tax=Telmatospirillum sp. J64-1 TaxID=2502183 RepID=UPI00115ECF34|nr:cytochrome c peroxidase [Telmatospirillum sp. J64-1]